MHERGDGRPSPRQGLASPGPRRGRAPLPHQCAIGRYFPPSISYDRLANLTASLAVVVESTHLISHAWQAEYVTRRCCMPAGIVKMVDSS